MGLGLGGGAFGKRQSREVGALVSGSVAAAAEGPAGRALGGTARSPRPRPGRWSKRAGTGLSDPQPPELYEVRFHRSQAAQCVPFVMALQKDGSN